MNDDVILYEFSREQVERGDFSPFLEIYGPDNLPTGSQLRDMMNSLIFLIAGYDDDPREIHSVPEIRDFYSAFHAAWPYWLYFCHLDTESFLTMVLCCLPTMTAMKVDGIPRVLVEYDKKQLALFLRQHFGHMNMLCERAGMSERMIFDRTAALFAYFHLPFDAEPPE